MTPRILAIIVTYNGAKWLREAVRSLGGSTVRPDVIAIDNGSTDGSQEILAELGVETVQMSANVGFGAANNVGLQRAVEGGYDFAYLLNQDARVDEKCLETLASAMTAEPRFGIASPLQFDGTGESLDLQFAKRCAGRLAGATRSIVEVPFVMAAHWMISRACLLAVGGFSPVFSQYGEDDNYIDRAHYHGFRVGVVPAAKAIHDRAQRPNPKERRMYLKCTAALAKVSDPNRTLALSLVSAPLELLAMGLYHCSLTPIRYIPTLLRRYPELIKYRKLSKNVSDNQG